MVNEWLIWGRRAAWCCSHTLSWIILLLSFPLFPQWPRLVFLKNRQGCLRVAMAFACGSAAWCMKCRSGMPGACRPQTSRFEPPPHLRVFPPCACPADLAGKGASTSICDTAQPQSHLLTARLRRKPLVSCHLRGAALYSFLSTFLPSL